MFVEMLTPIGSAFDNLSRQDKIIGELRQNNELTQQRLDTAKLNAENRKRELDIIEDRMRQSSISRGGNHVQLQMQPLHEPNREYIGNNPSFSDVDGKTIIGNYAY